MKRGRPLLGFAVHQGHGFRHRRLEVNHGRTYERLFERPVRPQLAMITIDLTHDAHLVDYDDHQRSKVITGPYLSVTYLPHVDLLAAFVGKDLTLYIQTHYAPTRYNPAVSPNRAR